MITLINSASRHRRTQLDTRHDQRAASCACPLRRRPNDRWLSPARYFVVALVNWCSLLTSHHAEDTLDSSILVQIICVCSVQCRSLFQLHETKHFWRKWRKWSSDLELFFIMYCNAWADDQFTPFAERSGSTRSNLYHFWAECFVELNLLPATLQTNFCIDEYHINDADGDDLAPSNAFSAIVMRGVVSLCLSASAPRDAIVTRRLIARLGSN